jgi:endogenous inhibitor of DNA gyrase (YacG/DUF329 family)
MQTDEWAEPHGYTRRCAYCGQETDSTYCSNRCALDDFEEEDENDENETRTEAD